MYCYKCGEEIPDDSGFCPFCGAQVGQSSKSGIFNDQILSRGSNVETNGREQDYHSEIRNNTKRSHSGKWLIVFFSVILLLSGGSLAFLNTSIGQFYIGSFYYQGKFVEQNYRKAIGWLEKAAEKGNADAQAMLGDCYYYGQGITQHYPSAVRWYTKSAEQGYAYAQYSLGYCYHYGQGVDKDYKKARELYEKAIEQGEALAAEELEKLKELEKKSETESKTMLSSPYNEDAIIGTWITTDHIYSLTFTKSNYSTNLPGISIGQHRCFSQDNAIRPTDDSFETSFFLKEKDLNALYKEGFTVNELASGVVTYTLSEDHTKLLVKVTNSGAEYYMTKF